MTEQILRMSNSNPNKCFYDPDHQCHDSHCLKVFLCLQITSGFVPPVIV